MYNFALIPNINLIAFNFYWCLFEDATYKSEQHKYDGDDDDDDSSSKFISISVENESNENESKLNNKRAKIYSNKPYLRFGRNIRKYLKNM